MTDSPKTVSDTIASKPTDAAVSPPKVPTPCDTKQVGEPETAAEEPPAKQEPATKPDLLKV
jgi:hypothetical protein